MNGTIRCPSSRCQGWLYEDGSDPTGKTMICSTCERTEPTPVEVLLRRAGEAELPLFTPPESTT